MPDFFDWVQTLDDKTSLAASDQVLVSEAGGFRSASVGDMVLGYSGFVDPHAFGAKGDGVFYSDGITVTGAATLESETHVFTSADVGKNLYVDSMNVRTVVSVNTDGNPRKVTLSGVGADSSGGNHYWIMGTDDTAALRAALAVAGQNRGGGISGGVAAGSKNRSYGRLVVLRPDSIYMVGNTSAEYNNGAGTLAALSLLPRTGIVGMAGVRNATIMSWPTHRGHVIMSAPIDGFHDFLTLANFSVHMNGNVNSSSSALNAVHLDLGFDGYPEVDAFFTISQMDIVQPSRDGLYYNGRGEGSITNMRVLNARRHGYNFDGGMDSTFVALNAGGCRNNAFRIYATSSSRFVGCKGFYSGKYGASDPTLSANWYIGSDHAHNSTSQFVGCESQESRGSGVLLEAGSCMLDFRIADPGRQKMIDERPSDTLPTIISGIHMRGAVCQDNDIRAMIRPDLGYWAKAGGASTNWGGAGNAVTVEAGPTNNSGTVKTMTGIDYPSGSGPFGGTGTSNGANTQLRVNGVAMT